MSRFYFVSVPLEESPYNRDIYYTIEFMPSVSIENEPKIPDGFKLSQNYPNPFNPSTTISFEVPYLSNIEILVYNIHGQLIRSLLNEKKGPGSYKVSWDGLDNSGNSVSSGTYIYQITGDTFKDAKQMKLVR